MNSYRKLGELLVSSGLITNLQLSIALAAQQTSNRRLGEILVERGFATEEQIAACLAEQYGYPQVDLKTVRPQPSALSALKPDIALEHCVLPIRQDGEELECIIADPVDVVATDAVSQSVRKRLVLRIAPRTQLSNTIRLAYGLDDKGTLDAAADAYRLPGRFGGVRARKKIAEVTLFDAFDHQLERKVTLAATQSMGDSERVQQRLVQAAARVPSKYVCAVYDWFEHDGHCWAVLERLEGESLGHILRTRGPRSVPQSAELIAQIAEGVDALHQAGGFTGLLTPENILVRPGGVLLAPFTKPAAEYEAPEIELGDSGTHLSDVYSLGTILWECATGENPHVAAAADSGANHVWAFPAASEELPAALASVLGECLGKEPEERYPSAILLTKALRSYNWHALASKESPDQVTTYKDRERLLEIITVRGGNDQKPSFWQRLFGKRAA
jgi:serine/threonine protein kinase